jgi:integrase/recombinase XerD
MREARWVLVDLVGKGKRLRTVPVPAWTKLLLDTWTEAAGIQTGSLFRAVNKGGKLWGETITEAVVWAITREYGNRIGKAKLAPHDLRRTCAKLCRASGGALEQIQLLLGHASIQTTERYLGTQQNLAQAVNDHLPIEVQRIGTRERKGPARAGSASEASRYMVEDNSME